MAPPLVLTAATAANLQEIGERLGRALAVGDVLALIGPLGAGKTTFVQGLARGMGIRESARRQPHLRPRQRAPGPRPLVHADLYRIEQRASSSELGLADAFDRAAVAMGRLDRFPEVAPAGRLELEIAIEEGGARRLTFSARGARAAALVEALA